MRLLSVVLLLVALAIAADAKRHRHREDQKSGDKREKHVNAEPGTPKGKSDKNIDKMLTKKAKHLSKKLWNKLKSDYKKTEELHEMAQCEEMNCHSKKQICLIHVQTGKPECVSKRALKQRKKFKSQYKKWKNTDWEVEDGSDQGSMEEKIKAMKEDAEKYIEKHGVMMKRKMQKMYKKEQRKESRKDKKSSKTYSTVTDALPHDANSTTAPHDNTEAPLHSWSLSAEAVCSQKELMKLGQDLLTAFKKQQDDANEVTENGHQIEKRNSKKKELREDDECICQAPVSWQFIQMDVNTDGHIESEELVNIEGESECLAQFVASCDSDDDGRLSEKEWCCCFADIAPPCLSALQVVPTDDSSPLLVGSQAIMLGAMVPQCDVDGFYKTTQCHSSTGYCWCVDKFGKSIEDTKTRGEIDCDKHEVNPSESNEA